MRVSPRRRSLHLRGQRKKSGEVRLANATSRLQMVFSDETYPFGFRGIRKLVTVPGARITQTTVIKAGAASEKLDVSQRAVPGSVNTDAQVRVHGRALTLRMKHPSGLDRGAARPNQPLVSRLTAEGLVTAVLGRGVTTRLGFNTRPCSERRTVRVCNALLLPPLGGGRGCDRHRRGRSRGRGRAQCQRSRSPSSDQG